MGIHNEDYILTRTSKEYQRLRLQAKLWEAATVRVLKQAGLGQGLTCLDLGCGPGEVMRLLGEMVGPTGHITGVDIDSQVGREALSITSNNPKSVFLYRSRY